MTFPSLGFCGVTLNTAHLERKHEAVRVFPNPAEKNIRIECSTSIDAYRVADLTGRILLKAPVGAVNAVDIDLSELQPGLYLITIQDKDGHEITSAAIKK